MSDYEINRMWEIADIAAGQVAAPRWGFVQSYNPTDHTATVLIHHGADVTTLSDELPIKMGGLRYAPVPNQMAFLVPESQDNQALVISGFAFNDITPPPSTTTSIGGSPSLLNPGETEILGPNGSSKRFNADGSIFATSTVGFNIQSDINGQGDVGVDGNLNNTKNSSVGTGYTGSFSTPTGQIVTVMNGIIVNVV
jgi:hypothetical protein